MSYSVMSCRLLVKKIFKFAGIKKIFRFRLQICRLRKYNFALSGVEHGVGCHIGHEVGYHVGHDVGCHVGHDVPGMSCLLLVKNTYQICRLRKYPDFALGDVGHGCGMSYRT